jgi:hypothetical protein
VGNLFGDHPQKLLLLGESHYVTKLEAKDSRFTKKMIKHVIEQGDEKTRFFRTIVELINLEGKSDFWNKVAFGNLIQRGLLNSWDQPTQEDYASVRGAFVQMVSDLQPKRIIVLSKRLWNFRLGEQGFEKIQSPNPLLHDVFWYTESKQPCLTMGTWHPSSIYGRMHKQEAKELINAFLQYSM